MKCTARVKGAFKLHFNQKPLIIRSPGRINLLGEHIDYNNRIVLPASIDKSIYLGIQKREDKLIKLYRVTIRISFLLTLTN